MAKKSSITIIIKDGKLEAEGHDFKGKACKDKMKFLKKIGQVQSLREKDPTNPEPGPHINIYHK